MSNTVKIYGLIDPRDHEVKYVGQSTDIMRRLQQHIADRGDTAKCDWIGELRRQGMKPQLVRLDSTTKDKAHAVENWWILFARHKKWKNVNGTHPSAWRADFGDMFSESLEAQYQEYVERLRDAEGELNQRHKKELETAKAFSKGAWQGRTIFFLINTVAWMCITLPSTGSPDDTATAAIVLIAVGIAKIMILETICNGYFDDFGKAAVVRYERRCTA